MKTTIFLFLAFIFFSCAEVSQEKQKPGELLPSAQKYLLEEQHRAYIWDSINQSLAVGKAFNAKEWGGKYFSVEKISEDVNGITYRCVSTNNDMDGKVKYFIQCKNGIIVNWSKQNLY